MMRLTRSASLLVAFYLLTSAATAYAECAWVLWNEETRLGDGRDAEWRGVTWTLKQAAASQAECKYAEQAQIKQFTTRGGTWKLVTRDLLVADVGVGVPDLATGKQYREVRLRILCLPDTVDPRGPKEK